MRYFLELCLRSVEAAILDINSEIIVIDNDSSDNSCEMVKDLFPNVKLIENKENSGFSKGNNIAVKEAKGEYLCILNPDTVVSEDTFKKLLDFSEEKENLGIVGCQLIDGRGKFLPESKRNIPYPKVAFKKMIGKSNDYYANHIQLDTSGKVEVLVGAFMFVKKAVYDAVGGFDEDYFMYGEDIDLSYKVLKAGYDNYYFGETTIIHFKGESTLKDANYAKRFYGAMQIFYEKHFKQNLVFNLLVSLAIQLVQRLKSVSNEEKILTDEVFLYSNENIEGLQRHFRSSILHYSEVKSKMKASSIHIYNLNDFEIKAVIYDMKLKAGQDNVLFRFLPKNANFILGSDSSVSRGEVQSLLE